MLPDEFVIAMARKSLVRNKRRSRSGAFMSLAAGLIAVMLVGWIALNPQGQAFYTRLMSKKSWSTDELNNVITQRSYRVGLATGCLLGIHFVLGVGLIFAGARGIFGSNRERELLLRLWDARPAAAQSKAPMDPAG